MTDKQLVNVELRDFPIAVHSRAEEHSEGLKREFTLIAGGEAGDAVPRRVLDLADRLEQQYGDYTAGSQRQIDQARERGEKFITVHVQVPATARAAALELGEMLAEADEYCRAGDLLSLVPDPDVLRFRTWYIEQFVHQIDGEPPVSWPEFIGATAQAPSS